METLIAEEEKEENQQPSESSEEDDQNKYVYQKPFSFLSSLGGIQTSMSKIKKPSIQEEKLQEKHRYKSRR